MPEIIEVEIVTQQLYERVLNERIVEVKFPTVMKTTVIRPISDMTFSGHVKGKKIFDVYRIGKNIASCQEGV